MKRNWRFVVLGGAAVAIVILVVVFWPAWDPLAGVETVALKSPNFEEAPQGEIIQGPFIEGLELTLGEKRITIVGSVDEADAVLEITDIAINLGDIEIRIGESGISGKASAVCTLTDLRTGEEHIMDFYLTLKNGTVQARLVVRRFWEFWK